MDDAPQSPATKITSPPRTSFAEPRRPETRRASSNGFRRSLDVARRTSLGLPRRASTGGGPRRDSSRRDSIGGGRRSFAAPRTSLAAPAREYTTNLADTPPTLDYSLYTRKRSIFIFWFLILFDSIVMPLALYFGLWYGTDLSPNTVFSIVTAALGGISIFEYVSRFWRLFKKGSNCRVIGGRRAYVRQDPPSPITYSTLTPL